VRAYESKVDMADLERGGPPQGLGDAWLRFGGVKLSVDGAHRGAAVYTPHPGEPEGTGLIRIPADDLTDILVRCQRAGLRAAVHVVGARATDMTLDAFEIAMRRFPRPGLRHRLEHLIFPHSQSTRRRIADLGLIASVQPSFIWSLGDTWADLWPTEDRRVGVMPFRTLQRLGIPMMGGTDLNGDVVSPFTAMQAAVTRRTPLGMDLGTSEALAPIDALRLQTTGAAYGGYDEAVRGSLEVGKYADLVMVSGDPLSVDPTRLGDIAVLLTMVGGDVVYSDGTLGDVQ
jgi:predicted amidohydrolase YtcJ